MEIIGFVKNGFLTVRVVPGAAKTQVREAAESGVKIALHAPPREGEANKELVRFLKKEFGLRVEIVKGHKSRDKVLRVY